MPLVSPVLAGDNTSITITYRVITPQTGAVSNAPDLQAVVDLLDGHDHLVSRGDPVLIPYFEFQGGGIQTAHVPYAVPSDARGLYHVRVYLRTPDLGGTVAEGDPERLDVVGGPDPEPVVSAAIHTSGSIEIGPSSSVGGTGGTLSSAPATTNLNANILLALQNLTYTFSAATTINPTSLRFDPLFTLVPGTPQVASPNSQQPVSNAPSSTATPAPHYQDTLGPVTAQLPSPLFSGGETLRGLDSIVNSAGWMYHTALGYPQLGSSATSAQEGYLLDVARAFSLRQNLRLTFLQNIDDPYTFVPTDGNQPQNARVGGVEFDQTIDQHLTLMIGGAASGASPETLGLPKINGVTSTDGADKATINYTSGANAINIEYHNFGADFATGNGLGAASDNAGGSAQASFALSRLATLALNFAHQSTRSAGYGDSQEGATFNIAPPRGLQLSFGGANDHTLGGGSDSTTRNYTFSIGSSGAAAAFNLAGSLATVADTINPLDDGVTRTGTLQYSVAHGPSSISLGVNATGNQVGASSASVAESAVITFPLGASSSPNAPASNGPAFGSAHGFEIELSGSNANQRAQGAGTRDLIFGALVSYHLGPHVSLGLHASTNRHTDVIVPSNYATLNSLRARLDLLL